jgi:hypothetical protein
MSIAATIGAVGSLAGAGASAAAASSQAGAAENAQQLQAQEAQNALNFQEQQWNTQQTNEAPFLKAGQNAVGELSSLTNTPGQGLLTPWTQKFEAPTAQQAEQTPGYQFTLGQGEQALQNSAAASGGLLAGGAAKGFTNYAEGLASNTYQQSFQNALTQYQTAYNTFQNNQTNTFNRLATMSGVGQTSAAQLGQQGQAAASNVGNINLTSGAQQGQDIQNAGAANASGYIGASNALTGGLNNLQGQLTLQQLLAGQSGNSSTSSGGLTWHGYGNEQPA